jgi:hypothetical protein
VGYVALLHHILVLIEDDDIVWVAVLVVLMGGKERLVTHVLQDVFVVVGGVVGDFGVGCFAGVGRADLSLLVAFGGGWSRRSSGAAAAAVPPIICRSAISEYVDGRNSGINPHPAWGRGKTYNHVKSRPGR